MNIPILFEDESLLVVDKPTGIVVNRSQSSPTHTLQDWAEEKLNIKDKISNTPQDPDSFLGRAGIVHRLDKETSGVLIIAKNEEDFIKLQKQFFERTVSKEYTALVHGVMESAQGDITAPVGRLPWDRMKFGVLTEGRSAQTHYTVSHQFEHAAFKYSLLSVIPHTGRTHQIRIHLKYINHPIVSDYLYAGRKTSRLDQQFCPRIFLHATKIQFLHPQKSSPMECIAPLAPDLSETLRYLQTK